MTPPAYARGLSLPELLIGVSLVAALLGLALPAFQGVIDQIRADTVANRLHGELAFARGEAVFRRRQVVMCRTRDFERCVFEGPWSQGVMTFEDQNGDRSRGPAEPILRVHPPSDFNGLHVVGSAGRPVIGFRPDGRSAGSNLTLRLCSKNRQARRHLVINTGGRTRSELAPKQSAPCAAS